MVIFFELALKSGDFGEREHKIFRFMSGVLKT